MPARRDRCAPASVGPKAPDHLTPQELDQMHALAERAPERLVWGSDWPHPNMNDQVMPNDGDLIDLMLDWVPEETVRNRILADNPRALYDFGPAGG